MHFIKQDYSLKTFVGTLILMTDIAVYLVVPSRANLKLYNIFVTQYCLKKPVTNLDLSKATGPDCIPLMVLKNCEPKLSYILA